MSKIIGLGGFSGSGKSSSLAYLNPASTFIISCTPKQLNIPGSRKKYTKLVKNDKGEFVGNWYVSNEFNQVMNALKIVNLKLPHVTTLVIDDANYLLSAEVIKRGLEKGYDKHTEFAQHYYDLIETSMTLRDDLTVVFISHIVNDGSDIDPRYKLFTTGKLLDRTLNIDGLFSYLLYAEKLDGDSPDTMKYVFRTRSTGPDSCRSVKGCFKDLYIEPNMRKVIETIDDFELNGEDWEETNDNNN